MIYLIGGTPRTGKSTLAAIILERNSIPGISTDVIRNLLDFSPTKLGFTNLKEDKRPVAFFPYFLQLLKILQNRYQNYVVEGDIFTPEQVASVQEQITLKCVFLGVSNATVEDLQKTDPRLDWIHQLPEVEKAKLSSAIRQGNWVGRLPSEKQAEIPARLARQSKELKNEAHKHHIPYVDIYPDRETALEAAYQAILYTFLKVG